MNIENLYVMGTNCVDNGPREGLDKFLKTASESPDTALHYEFMQVSSIQMAEYLSVVRSYTIQQDSSIVDDILRVWKLPGIDYLHLFSVQSDWVVTDSVVQLEHVHQSIVYTTGLSSAC